MYIFVERPGHGDALRWRDLYVHTKGENRIQIATLEKTQSPRTAHPLLAQHMAIHGGANVWAHGDQRSHAWKALQKIDKRAYSLIHQGHKPCPSCLKARTLKVERRSGEQWEVWCRRTTAMTMKRDPWFLSPLFLLCFSFVSLFCFFYFSPFYLVLRNCLFDI
ncbi:hypothetical protein I7I50_12681 [Histoplasma capsulatum G186AR]|uniref:Uncharacterized protein n=1 Tax=Ajellomyces capsulatus TaxID=5037 RepID=A0A8H7Y7K3_AJECA|nr:hypothetical protein I7I52_11014 [Histoplasma capsulatum]QSS70900.1 hypothetical protein I7I50_12681 [Histoplasma capsulatum G186AR]